MEIVKNTIESVLNNNIVKGLLVLFVILYASQISPPLPDFLKNFFNNPMGKGILIFLIVFYINKGQIGIGLAILLVILYSLLINVNNTQNVIETYSSYISNRILKGGEEAEEHEAEEHEAGEHESEEAEDVADKASYGGDTSNSESELEKTINEIIHRTTDDTSGLIGGIELEEQELEQIRLDERKLGNEQQLIQQAFKDTQDEIRKLTETYNLDKNVLESDKKYKSVIDKHEQYDTNTDKMVNYFDKQPEIDNTTVMDTPSFTEPDSEELEQEEQEEQEQELYIQDGGANLFNVKEEVKKNKKKVLGGLNIETEFGEAINSDSIFTSLGGNSIKPYEANQLASLQ